MKAKLYFIAIFLLLGVCIVQAQIKGQIQFTNKVVKTSKDNGFDRIISHEGFTTTEPGNPELPILLKSYLIPVNANRVTINIQNVSKQKVEEQYNIYPAQPPIPVGIVQSIPFIEPNPQIYQSELPYPGKSTEIVSDEFYLGYRVVTIRLYPFEYLPKRKELYACDINFSIDYTQTRSLEKEAALVTQNQTLYRYELNKKSIKFRVANPEVVDNYDTKVKNIVSPLSSRGISVLNEKIPEYIIITCDSLKPAFQPLANWKTKKGVYTIVKTVEEINANYSGSDLQKSFLS